MLELPAARLELCISTGTMFFQLFALVAIAASAAAAPTSSPHVLHEKREVPPQNWVKRDLVGRNVKLPMRIGMTQSNLHIGEDLLMEVYIDPHHIISSFSLT